MMDGKHDLRCKHTPGPWVADECLDTHGHVTIRRADGTRNGDTEAAPIATVYQPYRHSGKTKANATLIAAAPETAAERDRLKARNIDLRELLEWALDTVQDANPAWTSHPGYVNGRALIAKAKGE